MGTLIPLLSVLIITATSLCGLLIFKLLSGDFDRNKTQTLKIDNSDAADNFYTVQAAKEHVKVAEANARAEEARLERARLEKSDR
ncbi:MAG TPA: hypothetical protein VGE13_01645 [Candidatus Saccharimonadales bacterium]